MHINNTLGIGNQHSLDYPSKKIKLCKSIKLYIQNIH